MEDIVMSNTDTAKALLMTFENGDIDFIKNNVTEKYIQHNLSVGTGRDAFIQMVEDLQKAPTKATVKTIRSIEENNFVALQTEYSFPGSDSQVAFDVFRFERGKIAEHWDNINQLSGTTPNGHTAVDGPTQDVDLDKTATNKALVTDFVNDVLVNNNLDNINQYFDGDNYIQHDTKVPDGVTSFVTFMNGAKQENEQIFHNDIFKTIAQGDFVLTMMSGSSAGEPMAFYDLYRVENGKIVEHWDTVTYTPAQSQWANQNGKF